MLETFFSANGYEIPDFVTKMEDIAVGVAKREVDKEDLKKIFRSMFISFGYSV